MNQRLSAVAVGAGVLAFCTGCGSTAPSVTATTNPTAAVPTRSQVKAAMLEASDVPASYVQTPNTNSSATGAGPNASCHDLAKVTLSNVIPGALFEVDRGFENANHLSISESVAPYKTVAAARAVAERFSKDVSRCPTLTVTVSGTSITFSLSVAAKPSAGSIGSSVTMTGTGAISGLVEVSTMVVDGSTLIGVSAPTSSEADSLTTLAVNKLDKVMDGSPA
jgi:hypothetical protein